MVTVHMLEGSTEMWRLSWSVGFIQRRETNHVNLKPEICVKTTELYLLWVCEATLSHSWHKQCQQNPKFHLVAAD